MAKVSILVSRPKKVLSTTLNVSMFTAEMTAYRFKRRSERPVLMTGVIV